MKTLGKWAALLLAGILATSALAADKQLRIGTLATKNSLYHRQLMELGEAWRTAQGGNAKYLVYPDGSQGGETDMVRRMRIGQLQGGLLSVVGLREIEPSITKSPARITAPPIKSGLILVTSLTSRPKRFWSAAAMACCCSGVIS